MLKRIPTLTLFFFSLDHISLLQAFRESGNCNSTYLLDKMCIVFVNHMYSLSIILITEKFSQILSKKEKLFLAKSGGCFQICECVFFSSEFIYYNVVCTTYTYI